MKHAREDYNRFQDPDNKIPEDEPVLLLRGQDELAHLVAGYWADLAQVAGVDLEMVKLVRDHAQVMKDWPVKKLPDLT